MAQSVERAIALVRRAAEGSMTLTEAATMLGVHKSSALRLLQTLEAARFVRRTGAGTYVVGSGIIELSEMALGSMDLRQAAHPHLVDLQRRTGHTVHLAQLTGDEVVYVDKVDSPALDGVQLPSRIGRAVSIYASAVGKVILAHRSAAERDHLLHDVDFQQFTPTTFAGREALEAELDAIRDRGWARDRGEHDSYVMCVGVPVRDSRRDVVAALSVTAIEVIATLADLEEHVPLLLETAEAISREAGYVPKASGAEATHAG
jgi:DNA-binding IclR family transcriptional regulator